MNAGRDGGAAGIVAGVDVGGTFTDLVLIDLAARAVSMCQAVRKPSGIAAASANDKPVGRGRTLRAGTETYSARKLTASPRWGVRTRARLYLGSEEMPRAVALRRRAPGRRPPRPRASPRDTSRRKRSVT